MKLIIFLLVIQVAFSTFLNKQSQSLTPSLNFWNYAEGGDDWQSVNSWQCNGQMQSPINIQLEDVLSLPNCKLYSHVDIPGSTKLEILNTGHSLKVEGKGNLLSLKVNGAEGNVFEYECGTINMHAPSEHTIESNHFDLEMHIVCKEKNTENEFGVLTLLFEGERNVENSFFEPFGAAAASLKYKGDKASIIMDFQKTFESEIAKLGELYYYNYQGSFTVQYNFIYLIKRLLHALRKLNGISQTNQ